jgi:hypothetical protein
VPLLELVELDELLLVVVVLPELDELLLVVGVPPVPPMPVLTFDEQATSASAPATRIVGLVRMVERCYATGATGGARSTIRASTRRLMRARAAA